jgi:hypothetical protein
MAPSDRGGLVTAYQTIIPSTYLCSVRSVLVVLAHSLEVSYCPLLLAMAFLDGRWATNYDDVALSKLPADAGYICMAP